MAKKPIRTPRAAVTKKATAVKKTTKAPVAVAPKRTAAKKKTKPPVDAVLERAKLCARIADDKKGEGIIILDLRKQDYVAEYFVIATGSNERQRMAIAGDIQAQMRELGERPFGVAGEKMAQWILVDFVDIVIHVFSPDARKLYDLELLWGDAPRVDWKA
jgi:ribosome-associated protein